MKLHVCYLEWSSNRTELAYIYIYISRRVHLRLWVKMAYPRETLCFAQFRDMFFPKICTVRSPPIRKHFSLFWANAVEKRFQGCFCFFAEFVAFFRFDLVLCKRRSSSSVDDEDIQRRGASGAMLSFIVNCKQK